MSLLGLWNMLEIACKILLKATLSLHRSFIVTAHVRIVEQESHLPVFQVADGESMASMEDRARLLRVPLADGTLLRFPVQSHSDKTFASLLTLSDVMSTGHHAAKSAGVKKGDTVAVVGDGAVGLCAIIAQKTFRRATNHCLEPKPCSPKACSGNLVLRIS